MTEILNVLRETWPAGAGFLVLILAYIGVRKYASPKDWKTLRNLLRSNLVLSLDISITKIVNFETVLITIGYLRKNKPFHHNDYNSIVLDLYENCMKYHYCFWWTDKALPLFMGMIMLCIVLFSIEPIWVAICIVIYFSITLLAADKAKDLEKSIDENSKNGQTIQIDYLKNNCKIQKLS